MKQPVEPVAVSILRLESLFQSFQAHILANARVGGLIVDDQRVEEIRNSFVRQFRQKEI